MPFCLSLTDSGIAGIIFGIVRGRRMLPQRKLNFDSGTEIVRRENNNNIYEKY